MVPALACIKWFDCHLPGAVVSQGTSQPNCSGFPPPTRQSASIEAELLGLTSIYSENKVKHTCESAFGERIISQLRTGYVRLNEYLHKCNLKDTDQCQCGSKESISHFLLDCPNYETKREIMRKRLFDTCRIAHLDLNLLLDAKQDDEFTDWRSNILTKLENFVVGTGQFAT